jgi:hypothetical protein
VIRLLAIMIVLGASVAAADTAQRKTAPDKFTRAASEAFVAALAADHKGDLQTALIFYQKALALSPHPSTAFNIADILRRQGKLTESIRSYEMYLAISPDAPDRKVVEALIDKLARTPGSVFVSSTGIRDLKSIDLSTAYVLIDGKIVSKPGTKLVTAADAGDMDGIELIVAPGDHVLDVITPLTYGFIQCEVRPNERSRCVVSAPPRIDGTVVISGTNRHLLISDRPGKRRGNEDTKMLKRFEVKPGRTKFAVRDRSYECPALVLDVPSGGDLAYVFIAAREPSSVDRCRAHDMTRARLHFDP